VLWKAASSGMTPLRDPVKNIVYNATAEDIDRVRVNGRLVVDAGHVIAADERAILAALQAAGERMWPRVAQHDWAGRDADGLSPPPYPEWR
jgi:5-methylthioadenosine/S-adenosylhomocysteine deaminase